MVRGERRFGITTVCYIWLKNCGIGLRGKGMNPYDRKLKIQWDTTSPETHLANPILLAGFPPVLRENTEK